MKKQEYIDMGLQAWLTLTQIEGVLLQILHISQKELFLLQDISSKYIYEIQKYFYEIASGKPQEYVLWVANFYGRDFFVDSRVLIPRNDTEILVWAAVKYVFLHPELSTWVFVDVGTGSGCIALSVLQEIFPLKFSLSYAFDLSLDALEVCKKNAKNFPDIELQFLQSNLLEALSHSPEIQKKPLFMCANLPYIKDNDTLHMDASVVKHEPHSALFWGKNTGFELYEKLIKQCFQLKHIFALPEIHIFVEIGFDQYEYSKKYLEDFWLWFEYFRDSASIYRVIHIHGF